MREQGRVPWAHLPPVAPGAMSQTSGLQHSDDAVQLAPAEKHGMRQVEVSGSHAPEQHCADALQVLPSGTHAAHVPPLVPGGAVQSRPVQQSPVVPHDAPVAAHDGHRLFVPQTPEAQHSAGAVEPCTHAEPGPTVQVVGVTSVQTKRPSMFSQVSPVQHSLDCVQRMPRVLHVVGIVQCRTPFASGTHGA